MTEVEGADSHVIDLAQAFPDVGERQMLLQWGASYLGDGGEDSTVRACALGLEVAALLQAQNRRRHRRLTPWMIKLSAIAFVTAAHRLRSQLLEVPSVRH